MACCSDDNNKISKPSPDDERMAIVFAALSNPARIDILRHIAKHRHCGCKDITDVSPLAQSTVSQHLKVLIEAEIVIAESVPPRSQYQVNEALLKDISFVTSTFLDSCCSSKCC